MGEFFTLSPLEIEAVLLSLRVAFWAVLVSLPIGIAAAWLLSRREFYGKTFLNGLLHLPLVLPPVVMGYLLLILFGRQGIIGGFLQGTLGVTIIFTWKGAAVASAVMAFPLMVRAIRQAFDALDTGLEAAARTLGAGPVRVFLTITLPLISPGVLAGGIIAFARSLGEFGATITFVSNIPGETQTLPLALFNLVQTPGAELNAARLVTIAVIIAFAALVASEALARRVSRTIGG